MRMIRNGGPQGRPPTTAPDSRRIDATLPTLSYPVNRIEESAEWAVSGNPAFLLPILSVNLHERRTGLPVRRSLSESPSLRLAPRHDTGQPFSQSFYPRPPADPAPTHPHARPRYVDAHVPRVAARNHAADGLRDHAQPADDH